LPINMIVIIAIAMLILVVVGAYFAGAFGSTTQTISLESAFNQACNQIVAAYNCDANFINTVKVNYKEAGAANPTPHSLYQLCGLKSIDMSSTTGTTTCLRLCGCA
jgi:hypothetical protein